MTFGQLLTAARKARNWTQDDVATAVGCTRSYLSLLESDGRVPSIGLLVRLAGALEVELDKLTRAAAALERVRAAHASVVAA